MIQLSCGVETPTAALSSAGPAGDRFRADAFGRQLADLEIAFDETPRPRLITQVLTTCVRDADGERLSEGTVAHWGLNRRLQALQAVVGESGLGWFSEQTVCAGCGETMEIDLDAAAFDLADPDETFSCRPDAANELRVRLPTGADQVGWLDIPSTDADELQRTMATRLVVAVNGVAVASDWCIPQEWIEPLAAELEQHDRGTGLELCTSCPSCGRDAGIALDLEARLLALLRAQQHTLLEQIHQLAAAYHWSERDILALTAQRRRFYLARIAGERAS